MEAHRRQISREPPLLHRWFDYIHGANSGVTIHGLGFLSRADLHPIERLTWVAIIVASFVCMVMTCNLTLTRFQENPTVIFLERNFEEWNLSFPAAFLCPVRPVNQANLEEMTRQLVPDGNKEQVNLTQEFLVALASASYLNLETLEPFKGDLMLPQKRFRELVDKIRSKFSSFEMNFFGWNDTLPMSVLLEAPKPISLLTEKGVCYTQNSLITGQVASKKGQAELEKELNNVIFVVNSLDGSKEMRIHEIDISYEAYWRSRDEMPELSDTFQLSGEQNQYNQILIYVNMYLEATTEVRDLAITQRKCRFVDESKLDFSNVYSPTTCIIDCRRKRAQKLCHCLPFFTQKGSSPDCTMDGMMCLAKNKDRLKRLTLRECGCLPSCEYTSYLVEPKPSIVYQQDSSFTKDMGSVLGWKIEGYPRTKYKRGVIFTFTDLLVSIGGTAGFFLGSSLLSLIEIIYLFTVRMFFHFRAERRSRQNRY